MKPKHIEILFEGMYKPKTFTDLLEAFEYVVLHKKQNCFLIKEDRDEVWGDGTKLFKGFQQMFAPVEED